MSPLGRAQQRQRDVLTKSRKKCFAKCSRPTILALALGGSVVPTTRYTRGFPNHLLRYACARCKVTKRRRKSAKEAAIDCGRNEQTRGVLNRQSYGRCWNS